MRAHRKLPRERYSLKPHEKREIVRLAGPKVDQDRLRALATRFDCSLKSVFDVLQNASVPVLGTAAKEEAPPSPKPARKTLHLKLAHPAPEPDPEPVEDAVPSTEENLARKLQLDRREREVAAKEKDLLRREAIVATKEIELEEALRHIDDAAPPEEIARKDARIADLERRLAVVSGEVDLSGLPKARLYSAGTVLQMLLAKDAKIEGLKKQLEAAPRPSSDSHMPESMRIL